VRDTAGSCSQNAAAARRRPRARRLNERCSYFFVAFFFVVFFFAAGFFVAFFLAAIGAPSSERPFDVEVTFRMDKLDARLARSDLSRQGTGEEDLDDAAEA
jgi:hypothetical protein